MGLSNETELLVAALRGLVDVCLDMQPDHQTRTIAGVPYDRYRAARIAAERALLKAGVVLT